MDGVPINLNAGNKVFFGIVFLLKKHILARLNEIDQSFLNRNDEKIRHLEILSGNNIHTFSYKKRSIGFIMLDPN